MKTDKKLELPKKYESPKLVRLGNKSEVAEIEGKVCRGSSGAGGKGGGCSWK